MVSATEMATEGGGVDDLSTDVLLNPAALQEATKTLNADCIGIVVPKRGWLLAAPASPGDIAASGRLFEMSGGVASRAGEHAVSGSVVLFCNASGLSGVEVREGSSGYVSLMRPDEDTWFEA